jgi:DNA-binding LytR/AlgR family response regulator
VCDARLARCVLRLQRNQVSAGQPPVRLDANPSTAPMSWFTAEDGDSRRLIHVQDVMYLRAQDKYTAVVTRDGRYVIRASLRELLTRLDPDTFVQIHRGTILNINAVERLEAEVFGRMRVRLKNCPDVLTVSRSFCDRFRPI